MSRPNWSNKQRAEILRDNGGKCHLCNRPIESWQKWHVEHPKARGFKGSDKQADMRPVHIDCHQVKTSAENRIMRKADRQMKSHFGTKARPKQTIQQRKVLREVVAKAAGGKGQAAHETAMLAKGKRIPARRIT
jgi:5-methylcytosine-specific restriction endonuclease McrA